MKSFDELFKLLPPAKKAWIGTIGPKTHNWGVSRIVEEIQACTGEQVNPASVEAYLQQSGLPIVAGEADATDQAAGTSAVVPFSEAMERDIELALVSQLASLGLRLYVDDQGRSGKQYQAGEHGNIDVLALDSSGNFVVIELKRAAPRSTIGQLAGYIAYVRKHLAKPAGRSAVGWIVARPTSEADDRLLEEAAEAVGMIVKWYTVRLEFLAGGASAAG